MIGFIVLLLWLVDLLVGKPPRISRGPKRRGIWGTSSTGWSEQTRNPLTNMNRERNFDERDTRGNNYAILNSRSLGGICVPNSLGTSDDVTLARYDSDFNVISSISACLAEFVHHKAGFRSMSWVTVDAHQPSQQIIFLFVWKSHIFAGIPYMDVHGHPYIAWTSALGRCVVGFPRQIAAVMQRWLPALTFRVSRVLFGGYVCEAKCPWMSSSSGMLRRGTRGQLEERRGRADRISIQLVIPEGALR